MIYLFSIRYREYVEHLECGNSITFPSVLIVTADSDDEARSNARSLLAGVFENHLQYTSTPDETLKQWMEIYESDLLNFRSGDDLFIEGQDLMD